MDTVGFKTYIGKVLKQVHQDTGMTGKALGLLNSIILALGHRLIDACDDLLDVRGEITYSSRTVQAAVALIYPGELAKHARGEGAKAVTKYQTAKVAGQKGPAAAKAGLVFPPSRARRLFRPKLTKKRISVGASVYLAAVLEYITAEFLELAGNVATDQKRVRITEAHIMRATTGDREIEKLIVDNNMSFITT